MENWNNRATCGHWTNKVYVLSIMNYNRCNERVVDYGCYCKRCAKEYEKWGIVLDTEERKMQWLRGEINYPEI